MACFTLAAALLLASVQAKTPDNVSSRLSVNVSLMNEFLKTIRQQEMKESSKDNDGGIDSVVRLSLKSCESSEFTYIWYTFLRGVGLENN